MKVLIFDRINDVLAVALAKEWKLQGGTSIDASSNGGIDCVLNNCPEPHGFIFTESNFDETALLKECGFNHEMISRYGEMINDKISSLLNDFQIATKAMLPARKGHVLCLCLDDVSAHILGLPESPIVNQARNSAMKSLAKEYSRIGINFNTVIYQPPKE
ncbi:hypothetical protein [Marinomonas sp. 2405UD68-3]|uniref:hypothetical protein n=1 Tax=Marinomonas sp. 2405UD68-3 TaxID=3391835 RepID=UPI0039C8EB77